MKSYVRCLIVALCSLLSFNALSTTETPSNCKQTLPPIEAHPAVQQQINPVITLIEKGRLALCQTIDINENINQFTQSESEQTIKQIARELPAAVGQYYADIFDAAGVQAIEIERTLILPIINYADTLEQSPLTAFQYASYRHNANTGLYYFNVGSNPRMGAKVADQQCDKLAQLSSTQRLDCGIALEALADVLNHLNSPIETIASEKADTAIKQTLKRWERFNNNARAMTFLDSLVTYQLQGGYYQQVGNDGPADWQFFLLHPVILIEQIPDAVRGERTDLSYGLEVFGVNCWDCFDGKFPIGASVTAIYTDRPDVSDFGAGLSLHLFNHYTIGYTHRNNGSGFYIDINLVEWLTDKNAHYERGLQELKDSGRIAKSWMD